MNRVIIGAGLYGFKAENLLVVDHAILRDAIFSEEQPAAFYNRQLTRGKIIVYEFEKGELL